MPVTEILQSLGSWSLTLRDETPDSVRSQLGPFGHVAVLDGPVDVELTGDGLLTKSRYVGVLREGEKTLHPGGSGMASWLGEEDNGADVFANKVTFSSATLAQVVTTLMQNVTNVTVGTVYPQADAAKRYGGEHQFVDVRTVLTRIAAVFGAELRVNGDGTLDVGTPAQLYGADPRAIIKRRGAGTDLDLTGLDGGFDADNGFYDYSTGVVLLGQTTEDRTIVTATKSAVGVPYLNLHGLPVKFVRLISESGEGSGTVEQRATLKLNEFYRAKRSVSLDLADFEADDTARVGGYVWVYDPDTGLADPANQVLFRGEALHPVLERVSGATWQVREGMTVGFRTHTGTWLDLTRWVVWETGSDELTVGDLDGTLTSPNTGVQDRLDGTRGGGLVNGVAPKPPTFLSLATESEQDPAGLDVSRIVASWVAPTQNTDDTLLTDLDHFTVQFRRPTVTAWEETSTADVSVILPVAPGLDYIVRVRAVDSDGQASEWTPTEQITAASDSTAPPTPSDPQVSTLLGRMRVEWDGLSSAGQPMPSDLNRVEVHVGTTSGFTPDMSENSTTRVDALLTAGPSYPDTPYGITRWARLVAVDHQGNVSGPSGSVAGSSSKVVSDDVFDGAIGSAKLADLAVITSKIDNLAVNDAKIGSVAVGKLTAGIMSADVTVSGRFTTALTGQRAGIDALGHFAYNSANALTVRLDGVNNLITGKTQTAMSGARVVIDNNGGLISYAEDGTTPNVQIFRRADGIDPAVGPWTGMMFGYNVGLRFKGTSANEAAIGKNGIGDALQLRGASDTNFGAGIDLYENNDKSGLDGDGEPYNGSIRFRTNGGLQPLRLLKSQKAVFSGLVQAHSGMISGRMRSFTANGGDLTLRSVDTYAPITNYPTVVFTAPPSGVVMIYLTIYLRATGTGEAQADLEVRSGDVIGVGTIVSSPNDQPLVANQNPQWVKTGGAAMVEGLTPGNVYHTRPLFRTSVTGQDVYAEHSFLVVQPNL